MKTNDARIREIRDSLRTKSLKHSLLIFQFPVDIPGMTYCVTSIPSHIPVCVYVWLAVSLGEAIARKAATADIMTQDDSCQTSPVLLQSLKRSLNNRVGRATNPHSVWRKPQPSKPGQLF